MGEPIHPSSIEKLMLIVEAAVLLGTVVMIVWVGWRYATNSRSSHSGNSESGSHQGRGGH